MNVSDAHLIVDIARLGSFAGAARARGVDPSSVSRTVASIEAELGFRLFQRATRRVALTEAGDIYIRRIGAIAEEFDHARDEALAISAGPAGVLRMTASVALGENIIVPLLPRFRAAFPKVELDLVLTDTKLDLIADRIDLAVRLGAERMRLKGHDDIIHRHSKQNEKIDKRAKIILPAAFGRGRHRLVTPGDIISECWRDAAWIRRREIASLL
jgi:DNA-binding transcriptional LysR family regulator